MNKEEQDRIEKLLQQALPRTEADAAPARDLLPQVLQRIDAHSASIPWFDWALLIAIIALATSFPASIPVFLYYL